MLNRKFAGVVFALAAATVCFGQSNISTAQSGPAPRMTGAGCTLPFSAMLPAEGEPVNDEALEVLPADLHDVDLTCESPGAYSSKFARAATTSSSADGWTVVAGTVREFRSTDSQYLFSVAAVKDRYGRQGVLLSRGIYISVNGAKVVNWERRVMTNDQLVEYSSATYATKSLIDDIISFVTDKVWPLVEQEFGKLITDAIKELFKQASKWLQKEIANLFEKGKSSQVPKLYLSQIQTAGASVNVAERYATSIIASRSSGLSLADKVFVSLSQPVEQTGEARAGRALSKAIEQIR